MDVRKIIPPYEITSIDPWLEPHAGDIELRMNRFKERRWQIAEGAETLNDFANGFLYYGFHRTENGWVFREWLPGADEVRLIGDYNDWNRNEGAMERLDNGNWKIRLEGKDALKHGQYVKLWVRRGDNWFERLPAYSTKVSMDESFKKLCTQVWAPETAFEWTDAEFMQKCPDAPLIYEAHVGMAQDKEGIGTYREFADNILPRVRDLGYNTIQLMAIQEHPYYGSFGYQVTNFFAAATGTACRKT